MLTSTWAWVLFAVMLLAQNFAFTVVSRARNSGSDIFHGIAAVFSNGIWLVVNVFLFAQWQRWWETESGSLLAGVAGFYVVFTVLGSVLGGKISRRFFEQGKRRVGHYDDKVDVERQIQVLRGRLATVERSVLRQLVNEQLTLGRSQRGSQAVVGQQIAAIESAHAAAGEGGEGS